MNINWIKRCTLIGGLVLATSVGLPAHAAHGGDHGGGPGWWGLGLGLGLGWEIGRISGPYYYPPYPVYYYPAPQYYYPAPPPAVIIQSPPATMPVPAAAASPTTPSAPNWYYCPPLKGYYPQVRTCPEPWHMVPGTPPGPIR